MEEWIMHRRITFICAAVLAMASPFGWAAAMSVVFINPGLPDEPFWRSVTRFMQPAAQQLDIQLEVLYADRNHATMIELARQVTQRAVKPDYLVLVNEKMAGGAMLKMAEQAQIKTLLAFSTFEGEQIAEFGTPREKYRHWLGSITPNSADAGMQTASELVRQARRAHAVADDGMTHVAVIAGDRVTPTGVQRVEGAVRVLESSPGVVLEQVVYANWERARAKEQTSGLLLRYPKLTALWAASDLMAYGAIDAAEAVGRKPGVDLMVSAFNNSPEVLRQRISGRISSLVGGHFTAGAWALVMLYDYQHGADFAREGLELRLPLFTLLDEQSARRFLTLYGDEDFSSIDFRQFSKHLHPRLQHYEFGLLPVLK
jgi:ABC-type sugar transport system substrate-binding protein